MTTNTYSEGKDKPFDFSDKSQVISIEALLKYSNIGFKLVPIGIDSKTPAIKSTNLIYENPDYWSPDKIAQEHNRFKNVATTFGKTNIKDEDGKEGLYLYCLDIDSDNVLRILFDLFEELKSKTFVTKTKKDCGYHVYWLSHKQTPCIGVSKCKRGYEFEIKSDNSLGHCTLPPSQHRDDPYFKYQCVGLEGKISIDDGLYEKLLQLLSKDCLISMFCEMLRW